MIQGVIQLLQAQFTAPGRPEIRCAAELDPHLEAIAADPELLHRAISNLVLNAMDAMPQGGTLTMRTQNEESQVRIEVADSGSGLTPEECERIFTPYYTSKQHGTGLGLAIVQSVVSDHKGRISVQSQPGRGTTFVIELPKNPDTLQDDQCRAGVRRKVPSKAHLLIVDDEANTLASLSRAFRLAGHDATVCDNAGKALELAKTQPFDLILSDVVMPGKDGLTLLEELKAQGVTAPVVMMSGQAHIEMAVRATRLGALDFLEKPISTEKLLLTVENALKLQRLESENRQLRQRLGKHEIVWTGEAMRRVIAQLERVAASETRVCILGETGTGKELVARTIHERSPRAGGPFVTLNCAAVPAELIESELFGHEKGSFTGAAGRHVGKFEQADGGTIFLDEIGDMPLAMQAKLLRVLEEGEVERIGSDKPVAVDVRVLVATHRDLEARVREEKFRQDLFHRVYVFPLALPPLRERREDIPQLVEHFAAQVSAQNGWKPIPFTSDAMESLQSYSWPGNVRELRNMVERLMLLATEGRVDLATVQMALPKSFPGVSGPLTTLASGALADRVESFEREVILGELKRSHHNVSLAAKSLGLERSHLYKKAEQLGIDLRAMRRGQE